MGVLLATLMNVNLMSSSFFITRPYLTTDAIDILVVASFDQHAMVEVE